ncbi:MAG: hypothetical protein U0232_03240 [Thermomicrobiales bacterium]
MLLDLWACLLVLGVAGRRALSLSSGPAPLPGYRGDTLATDLLYPPALLAGGLAAGTSPNVRTAAAAGGTWPDRPLHRPRHTRGRRAPAAILAGLLDGRTWSHRIALVAGAAVAHLEMPFELHPPATVVA